MNFPIKIYKASLLITLWLLSPDRNLTHTKCQAFFQVPCKQ